jgi:hypothetical protein
VSDDRDWAALFDERFAHGASAVEERIWSEVFGQEYLEELAIQAFSAAPSSPASPSGFEPSTFWVAVQTGARLVGVDISSVALDAAGQRANRVP